jgi:hypothetical protein
MRDLSTAIFSKFQDSIIETALAFQEYVPSDACVINPYRKIALEKLEGFRRELQKHRIRLQKADMLKVAETMTTLLAPYDPQVKDGILNTDNGNSSIILQTGVVVAAFLDNQRMLQIVELCSAAIADYLNAVYDFFAIDPGDPKISELSHAFVVNHPKEADEIMPLLDRLTKTLVSEIHLIPEKDNYLARHMFLTGLIEYPGICCEVEIIRNAHCSKN